MLFFLEERFGFETADAILVHFAGANMKVSRSEGL